MDIIVTNGSSIPLYEQISSQIKTQILKGDLKEGEMLPSIRMMAKELKLSIITIKHAYEDLEAEWFIETTAGKGSFLSLANKERLRESQMSRIEEKLEEIIAQAKAINMTEEEIKERVEFIYREVD